MKKPIAWMYITDVCNRFEEVELTKVEASDRYREYIVEVVPLYREVEDG